ncbi:hypothetical protein CsSME_00021237 [Camellia sinensis var. sinensis]
MAQRGGDLDRIGLEAFDFLDEVQGRKHRPQPRPRPHQELQNGPRAPPAKEAVINCNQAAKIYGGIVVKDFGKKRHVR